MNKTKKRAAKRSAAKRQELTLEALMANPSNWRWKCPEPVVEELPMF